MNSGFKKDKRDEDDSGTNLFQNLDKTAVLQDTRLFNVNPIRAKKCTIILVKLLYLINQGEQLSTKEATDVFFNITKSFQSNDVTLRRMVYLAIKELCTWADDVIIVTSSLTKDMTGKEDLYRAAAIRALCSITDSSMLQSIERYMKQAIVDKNPSVSSAALVSSVHLINTNPNTAETIKRWSNEILEAVNSDDSMVQYHALGLLYQLRKHDRLAVIKLVTKFIQSRLKSPLNTCLLIRIASKLLDESDVPDGQLLDFIESMLRYKPEMVIYEAANALVNTKWITSNDLGPVVRALQAFLSSSKALMRFAAIRTLNKIASSFPQAVADYNVDIENLIEDSNRSVATLAITTLLKTGSESSVDRLMKQISSFMPEISDEFKVSGDAKKTAYIFVLRAISRQLVEYIVVIESIKALSLKYPSKTQSLMTYLSTMLRDEGGLEFKVAIAEAIITLIDANSEATEIGLAHLCEFIEDCEHSSLAVRVLHLLGREGPKSANPHKYIRFIYNRVILEKPQIRVAAVSALAHIAACCEHLRAKILVLLGRCSYDEDCDVRDLAIFYSKLLQKCDERPTSETAVSFIVEPFRVSVANLERSLVGYLLANDYSKPFDVTSVPRVDDGQLDGGGGDGTATGANIDDLSKVLHQNHSVPKTQSALTNTIDKQSMVLKDEAFYEQLNEIIPNCEELLGTLVKRTDPIALTESETEYTINLIKHCYKDHIVLQFHCLNTLNDQLLENVTIAIFVPKGFEMIGRTELKRLPYGDSGRGSIYVVLKYPNNVLDSIAELNSVLKFIVKDCDPISGEPDSEQGYKDEYPLEALEIALADQMYESRKPELLTVATNKSSGFLSVWNELDAAVNDDNDDDDDDEDDNGKDRTRAGTFVCLEETFALYSMSNLAEAVTNIVKFLGLIPFDKSDKVADLKSTHTLLLAGVFRNNIDVYVCAKLAVSETTGVQMKLIVKSVSEQVAKLVISSIDH